MGETNFPHELFATPQQAQDLVAEIERITTNAVLLPGHLDTAFNKGPSKKHKQEGISFVRYPDGKVNDVDVSATILASAAWNNEDGTRTAYSVEQSLDGLRVTKRIHPPSLPDKIETRDRIRKAEEEGDIGAIVRNRFVQMKEARRVRSAVEAERSFGLHLAYIREAEDLITRLQAIRLA